MPPEKAPAAHGALSGTRSEHCLAVHANAHGCFGPLPSKGRSWNCARFEDHKKQFVERCIETVRSDIVAGLAPLMACASVFPDGAAVPKSAHILEGASDMDEKGTDRMAPQLLRA